MTDTQRRPLGVGLLIMPTEDSALGTAPRWTEMLAMVRRAEELGYDTVWLPDHLIIDVPRPGSRPEGTWEGWSLASALAAATERIRIGLLVSCTAFRNPALARQDGRHGRRDQRRPADPGSRRRLVRAGVPCLRLPLRPSRRSLRGGAADHRGLLRNGHVDYRGDSTTQVRDCELRPRGPRPQGPPILVGSSTKGERMLRLAARHADIWNRDFDAVNPGSSPIPARTWRRPKTGVDAVCPEVGRDPATLDAHRGRLGRSPDRPTTGELERADAAPPMRSPPGYVSTPIPATAVCRSGCSRGPSTASKHSAPCWSGCGGTAISYRLSAIGYQLSAISYQS